MNIRFDKVKLVNFLSYKEAEVDLKDKGFCGLIGVNRFKDDNSGSNGSGKSTIISAISYALLGETVQGVKKELKNKYAKKSDKSYVELDFWCDNHTYKVTRSEKSLSIIYDGEDVSGKTKTDSEGWLESYLPGLTKRLLNSTILLGQGLPDKFSSLTPVKRKEALEELLHIDEYYEELNDKINSRASNLKEDIASSSKEKEILEAKTIIYKSNLEKSKNKLSALSFTKEDEEELNSLLKSLPELSIKLSELQNQVEQTKSEKINLNQKLKDLNKEKEVELLKLESEFNSNSKECRLKLSINSKELIKIQKELKELSSKKICPTCGQEIKSGANLEEHKAHLEEELKKLQESTEVEEATLESLEKSYKENKEKVNSKNEAQIKGLSSEIEKIDLKLSGLNLKLSELQSQLYLNEKRETQLKTLKDTFIQTKKALEEEIKEYIDSIEEADKSIKSLSTKLDTLELRRASISNISKHLKDGFRAYLINDTVTLLNKIAQGYCDKIFKNKGLSLELSDKSIEIYFQGKNYFNLSGGEKQKIDLILQFALRKVLSSTQGLSCNILFLDEIFDNLDKKGVDEIVNFILEELSDVESTFIISHHSDELGLEYDTRYNIIKGEDGISTIHLMN